jgi:hypothetical protein
MKTTGITIDNEGHLQFNVKRTGNFITGGLVVGNTLYQNQFMILKAQKGDIKEHPMIGAGIDDMANDNDFLYWNKTIREELSRDGMKVEKLQISESGLQIKANY